MKTKLALILLAAALSACARTDNGVRVTSTSTPYADGKRHSEPVNYNGRNYVVSFTYMPRAGNYRVSVAGKGRALGGTAGDRAIVEQVARSTVRHFACPSSQKGHIIPGSQRHEGGKWHMLARCG